MMKTTCGIFLYDLTNRFLIVHPTDHPSNIWSIPKGTNESGETFLESAIRELKEETGMDLNCLEYTILDDINPIKYKTSNKQLKSFRIKINGIIDIDMLYCNSYFKHSSGSLKKEVDIFRMVTEKHLHLLHNTQQEAHAL
jgi:8-oxo-dGTP pyrophosphatase MutT (NUDIX family)